MLKGFAEAVDRSALQNGHAISPCSSRRHFLSLSGHMIKWVSLRAAGEDEKLQIVLAEGGRRSSCCMRKLSQHDRLLALERRQALLDVGTVVEQDGCLEGCARSAVHMMADQKIIASHPAGCPPAV